MAEPATTAPDPILAAHLAHLQRNRGLVVRGVRDVPDEAALRPTREGGSHLNWLVGHLVFCRDEILRALGEEGVWAEDAKERYGWGSSPASPEEARPLEELAGALDATQERLDAALAAATPERLAAERGRSTVGAWVAFMVWHDTYHTGQVALYRQLAGLPGFPDAD